MENYIVYMHTNKANGKHYIGITSKNAKSRWKLGKGYAKQKRFYSAIKSHGWDGFDHIILFNGLSKQTAEEYETFFIKLFNSNDLEKGYNIENGGVTHKLSEEQKDHLRKINTGKRHSEETKRKMSEAHKGMSTKWLTGKTASDITKQKMSMARRGERNPNSKHHIFQYDLQGNFIAEYEYMGKIKNALNKSNIDHISDCCRGTRRKAYGYMWSYTLEEKAPYKRRKAV